MNEEIVEIRNPKTEGRKKSEGQDPNAGTTRRSPVFRISVFGPSGFGLRLGFAAPSSSRRGSPLAPARPHSRPSGKADLSATGL